MKEVWLKIQNLTNLNQIQRKELAKVFLDTGKLIFVGATAAYFLPSLAESSVSLLAFAASLIGSLTSIMMGVIILTEVKES